MNRISDEDIDSIFPKHTPTPISPRAKEWNRLIELCPELARLVGPRRNHTLPPHDLQTWMFLNFIACFADSKRAEILRTIIFDNQADNLREIIMGLLSRDGEEENGTDK